MRRLVMILVIAVIVSTTVFAQDHMPPPAINIENVGSGNSADADAAAKAMSDSNAKSSLSLTQTESKRPVRSAYAPTVVPGNCQRSIAGAFQFAGVGASFGGTRQIESCLARELAMLLDATGISDLQDKAELIWNAEFDDWWAKRVEKGKKGKTYAYVCKTPIEKHCITIKPGEAKDEEEGGQ